MRDHRPAGDPPPPPGSTCSKHDGECSGHINIAGSVSAFTGKPFCLVELIGKGGQMDLADVRDLAMNWLQAAADAEADANLFAELTDPSGLAMRPEDAVVVIAKVRDRRIGI